jgi:hypothetical protein
VRITKDRRFTVKGMAEAIEEHFSQARKVLGRLTSYARGQPAARPAILTADANWREPAQYITNNLGS